MFAGPAATKMVICAAVNTVTEMAFDLYPDGKLDKHSLEYLESFSTNLMVSSLTGPISDIGDCGKWGTFAKQVGSGFANSTLSGSANGELSWGRNGRKPLPGDFVQGISTSAGFVSGDKNKWLVAGVDTLSDTVIDSSMQIWDIICDPNLDMSDFDWKRCAQTAV